MVSQKQMRGMKAGEKSTGSKEIKAYDVKLRKMVIMMNPQRVTLKNGRHAWKGISKESGIKLFRIGG